MSPAPTPSTLSPEHQEALDYIVGMADIGLAAMQPAVRKQNVKMVQGAVNVLIAALTPKTEPAEEVKP